MSKVLVKRFFSKRCKCERKCGSKIKAVWQPPILGGKLGLREVSGFSTFQWLNKFFRTHGLNFKCTSFDFRKTQNRKKKSKSGLNFGVVRRPQVLGESHAYYAVSELGCRLLLKRSHWPWVAWSFDNVKARFAA